MSLLEDVFQEKSGAIELPAVTYLIKSYKGSNDKDKDRETKNALINCYNTTKQITEKMKEVERKAYEEVTQQNMSEIYLGIDPSDIPSIVMRENTYKIPENKEEKRQEQKQDEPERE